MSLITDHEGRYSVFIDPNRIDCCTATDKPLPGGGDGGAREEDTSSDNDKGPLPYITWLTVSLEASRHTTTTEEAGSLRIVPTHRTIDLWSDILSEVYSVF